MDESSHPSPLRGPDKGGENNEKRDAEGSTSLNAQNDASSSSKANSGEGSAAKKTDDLSASLISSDPDTFDSGLRLLACALLGFPSGVDDVDAAFLSVDPNGNDRALQHDHRGRLEMTVEPGFTTDQLLGYFVMISNRANEMPLGKSIVRYSTRLKEQGDSQQIEAYADAFIEELSDFSRALSVLASIPCIKPSRWQQDKPASAAVQQFQNELIRLCNELNKLMGYKGKHYDTVAHAVDTLLELCFAYFLATSSDNQIDASSSSASSSLAKIGDDDDDDDAVLGLLRCASAQTLLHNSLALRHRSYAPQRHTAIATLAVPTSLALSAAVVAALAVLWADEVQHVLYLFDSSVSIAFVSQAVDFIGSPSLLAFRLPITLALLSVTLPSLGTLLYFRTFTAAPASTVRCACLHAYLCCSEKIAGLFKLPSEATTADSNSSQASAESEPAAEKNDGASTITSVNAPTSDGTSSSSASDAAIKATEATSVIDSTPTAAGRKTPPHRPVAFGNSNSGKVGKSSNRTVARASPVSPEQPRLVRSRGDGPAMEAPAASTPAPDSSPTPSLTGGGSVASAGRLSVTSGLLVDLSGSGMQVLPDGQILVTDVDTGEQYVLSEAELLAATGPGTPLGSPSSAGTGVIGSPLSSSGGTPAGTKLSFSASVASGDGVAMRLSPQLLLSGLPSRGSPSRGAQPSSAVPASASSVDAAVKGGASSNASSSNPNSGDVTSALTASIATAIPTSQPSSAAGSAAVPLSARGSIITTSSSGGDDDEEDAELASIISGSQARALHAGGDPVADSAEMAAEAAAAAAGCVDALTGVITPPPPVSSTSSSSAAAAAGAPTPLSSSAMHSLKFTPLRPASRGGIAVGSDSSLLCSGSISAPPIPAASSSSSATPVAGVLMAPASPSGDAAASASPPPPPPPDTPPEVTSLADAIGVPVPVAGDMLAALTYAGELQEQVTVTSSSSAQPADLLEAAEAALEEQVGGGHAAHHASELDPRLAAAMSLPVPVGLIETLALLHDRLLRMQEGTAANDGDSEEEEEGLLAASVAERIQFVGRLALVQAAIRRRREGAGTSVSPAAAAAL